MRLTRVQLYLLGGLMLAIVGPIVFSQQPDMGGRRSKGSKMDPNAFFDRLAPGKDSFNINDPLPPELGRMGEFMLPRWTAFLQQKGVTNGVMTRALFTEYSEESRRNRGSSKGFGKGGPPPVITTPGATPGAAAPPTPVDPKVAAAKLEDDARASFDRTDKNKDGVIDREEARDSKTLSDFDRWDLNKDGKISIEEYVEAYKARQASRSTSGTVVAPGAAIPEEDRRPVVYRAGKLPKELPAWFALSDKDNDGQVGLYEWVALGKPTIEFLSMDSNGDGFLTVEEVLRFEKAKNKDKQVASGPGGPGSPAPGQGDPKQGRSLQGGWGAAAGGAAGMSRGSRSGRGGPGGPGGGRSGKSGRGGPGGGRGPRPGGGAPPVPGAPVMP